MNPRDLTQQHERLVRDLTAWGSRREEVTHQLASARARLQDLANRRVATAARLQPDEDTLTDLRKPLATARDEVEELEAGLQSVDGRVAELVESEKTLTMWRQAVVLVAMLAQGEARAEAFARAQDVANRELERFLAAEAECERLAASLRATSPMPDEPTFSAGTLGRVALWRLSERLHDRPQGAGLLGWIEPSLRRPLPDFWREAWGSERESLEGMVRGR